MWTIELQEESVGKGEKIPVKVKEVKFFPIEGKKGEEIRFGKLGFLMLQVIIKSARGGILKLKLNASQGIALPTFAVQHEDTMERPLIWVGEGKRRQQITDVLAPLKKVAGRKEKYDTAREFEARLQQIGGQALSDEIMTLFAVKLADVAQRKDSKEKKAVKAR